MRPDDGLRAFRGIVRGVLVGALMWGAVIAWCVPW